MNTHSVTTKWGCATACFLLACYAFGSIFSFDALLSTLTFSALHIAPVVFLGAYVIPHVSKFTTARIDRLVNTTHPDQSFSTSHSALTNKLTQVGLISAAAILSTFQIFGGFYNALLAVFTVIFSTSCVVAHFIKGTSAENQADKINSVVALPSILSFIVAVLSVIFALVFTIAAPDTKHDNTSKSAMHKSTNSLDSTPHSE